MGIATRLGPWLLGTVKDTTGTTAGTIRNVGATPCQQFFPITPALLNTAGASTTLTVPAFALPPGSFIASLQFITDVSFQNATSNLASVGCSASIGTTNISASAAIIAGSNITVVPNILANATLPNGSNVKLSTGPTDTLVNLTFTLGVAPATSTINAGSGLCVIAYVVRNPDGSIT
jgi:hypothetical protein